MINKQRDGNGERLFYAKQSAQTAQRPVSVLMMINIDSENVR